MREIERKKEKFSVFDAAFYDRIMTASGAFNPATAFLLRKTHSQLSYCSRVIKRHKIISKVNASTPQCAVIPMFNFESKLNLHIDEQY